MKAYSKDIGVLLATDCGSTTSKARFFRKVGNEWRFVASGEAPTTVEAPFENVTLGVRNAIREVEELTGHKLLGSEGVIMPSNGANEGVDLYATTSSAGGGLQMVVTGVARLMTGESAERAALGAGAIVMDVIATDDGRGPYEKIRMLRFLRPDMILFAGGTDGGNVEQIVEIAQFLRSANPQARLGATYTLPIVYAGNKDARESIKGFLGGNFAFQVVDNIRPVLEVENVEPAREAIHELFMEHVMSHAPGYDKLMRWTSVPIMPTPAGEGMMFRVLAETQNINVLGVGLGGATTNVYSIYDGKFVRSVSANLGMSYSICNVMKTAGIENIMRWLPFEIGEKEVLNELVNKMIRPTTIPRRLKELMIEHAVAREALRFGFEHHKTLAKPLRGVTAGKSAIDFTAVGARLVGEETYIDMLKIHSLGGTGGLLSHAPRRVQSALILIDGFQLEGVTRLFQDSVFMMPHLGVLSTVYREVALEIFEKDCLVRLGTCVAFKGNLKGGGKVASMTIKMPNGESLKDEPEYGTIKKIPLKESEVAEVAIEPVKGFDVGAGPGHRLVKEVEGGVVGIIIDARGRPIELPTDDAQRRRKLIEWFAALETYPEGFLKSL